MMWVARQRHGLVFSSQNHGLFVARSERIFATGACSRLEPQPKLCPAPITSPGCTLLDQVGSTASNACAANTFASVVPRYLPAMMWSVDTSSPNVHTRPRNSRSIGFLKGRGRIKLARRPGPGEALRPVSIGRGKPFADP